MVHGRCYARVGLHHQWRVAVQGGLDAVLDVPQHARVTGAHAKARRVRPVLDSSRVERQRCGRITLEMRVEHCEGRSPRESECNRPAHSSSTAGFAQNSLTQRGFRGMITPKDQDARNLIAQSSGDVCAIGCEEHDGGGQRSPAAGHHVGHLAPEGQRAFLTKTRAMLRSAHGHRRAQCH